MFHLKKYIQFDYRTEQFKTYFQEQVQAEQAKNLDSTKCHRWYSGGQDSL